MYGLARLQQNQMVSSSKTIFPFKIIFFLITDNCPNVICFALDKAKMGNKWSANLVVYISGAPIIRWVAIKWRVCAQKRWRLYCKCCAISPILVRNFVTTYHKMMNYWKKLIFYRKNTNDYIFICLMVF